MDTKDETPKRLTRPLLTRSEALAVALLIGLPLTGELSSTPDCAGHAHHADYAGDMAERVVAEGHVVDDGPTSHSDTDAQSTSRSLARSTRVLNAGV